MTRTSMNLRFLAVVLTVALTASFFKVDFQIFTVLFVIFRILEPFPSMISQLY